MRRYNVAAVAVCAAAALGQANIGGGGVGRDARGNLVDHNGRIVEAAPGAEPQRDARGNVINPARPQAGAKVTTDSLRPTIVATLTGHTDAALELAFSPDGKRLLSGGADGTVRMWSVETAKELWRVDSDSLIFAVAFSPDGRTVAYSTPSGQIITADAATGEVNDVFRQPCTPAHLAFLPDAKRVICPCSDSLRIYSPGKAAAETIQAEFEIHDMAVSDKGLIAVVPSKSAELMILDSVTGKQIATHSRPMAVPPLFTKPLKNLIVDIHFMGEDLYVNDVTGVWKWTQGNDALTFVMPAKDSTILPVLGGDAIVTMERADLALYTSDYLHDFAFQSELQVRDVAWNAPAKLLAVSCGGLFMADGTYKPSGPRPIRIYSMDSFLQKAMAAKPGSSYKQKIKMPENPAPWQ